MSFQSAGDKNIDGTDDLHRFVVKFRPTAIIIHAIFGLVFVALRIWPLAALFMLIAVVHFCMMRWDQRHGEPLANSTPWMWWLYLGIPVHRAH